MAVALLAGCGGEEEAAEAPDSLKVNIASFKFVPDPVKLQAGGTITWVNQDKAPHTAEQPGKFDTGRLELGDSKNITFDEPGTYEYYCVFHRFMTGTVEVVRP